MMHFDIVYTFMALLSVFLLFAVWHVSGAVRENRRIKKFCLSLDKSLRVLKTGRKASAISDMTDAQKVSFLHIQLAFNCYIKPSAKYKLNLLNAINQLCGAEYSLYDMHDCFENSRLNGFFRDIVANSGFLFINMVYMSCLEEKGYYTASLNSSMVQKL